MDEIKLDRSIIAGIEYNERTKSIMRNTILLAQDIGISIVAEGVETHEQKIVFKNLNCPIVQGYLYSPPIPEDCLFKNTLLNT